MANKNAEMAQKVVDRICDMINDGKPLPWVQPWGKNKNTVTVVDGYKEITIYPTAWNRKGTLYKGSNSWLPAGEYITFEQCRKEGGKVKKGAESWPVVYWNFVTKEEEDGTGKKVKKTYPMLRLYRVFAIEDTTLEQKNHPEPQVIKVPITHEEVVGDADASLNSDAEAVIADYISRAGNGFKVIRDGVSKRAFYSPSQDYVQVPCREQFVEQSEFYSTMFHELGHSTGHACRLNRFTGKAAHAAFGSEEYSREELVAETTAATLLNALGMEEGNTFRNSAAYIKSWSQVIQNDPLMFVTAATRAQAAVDLILGVEHKKEEEVG